jgi:hypothetical protein
VENQQMSIEELAVHFNIPANRLFYLREHRADWESDA